MDAGKGPPTQAARLKPAASARLKKVKYDGRLPINGAMFLMAHSKTKGKKTSRTIT
jgi:hypothetical protein